MTLLLSDDSADSKDFDDSSDSAFATSPSTLPIVATLPLLLKIYMQQAMESLSRDDSQQRDRDPERSKRRET